ncbi:hypothetical protein ACS0PU_000959 [Formica fusca]
MAGLCNRSQWYLQAAALLAFYLMHDDSTRLHSRRDSLSLANACARERSCTIYPTYTAHTDVTRVTVVACRSFVRGSHIRPSRTRAVKASQSSFHPCSLHGRTSREYAAIRKEIKSEERPTNGLDTPGYIYITLMCYMYTYV